MHSFSIKAKAIGLVAALNIILSICQPANAQLFAFQQWSTRVRYNIREHSLIIRGKLPERIGYVEVGSQCHGPYSNNDFFSSPIAGLRLYVLPDTTVAKIKKVLTGTNCDVEIVVYTSNKTSATPGAEYYEHNKYIITLKKHFGSNKPVFARVNYDAQSYDTVYVK